MAHDVHRIGANTAMRMPEAILETVEALLGRAERRDDPAELERVLTDGYAVALDLERERAALGRDLDRLRERLAVLRRRHSAAVRATAEG
ncbi:MAG: hypothetical protein WCH31_09295 [Actinomycetes bacterium]